MKKKIISVFFSAAVILVCCKTQSKTSTAINDADVNYAISRWNDATKESLTEGQKLYKTYCGECHALLNPKKESENELTWVVPDMAKKAKLTEAQGDLILRYMLTKKNASP